MAGLDALLKFLIDGGCSKEEQEKVKILIAQVKDKKLELLRQKTARSHTWVEDASLPGGWKSRTLNGRHFFLSPEFRQVAGHKALLKILQSGQSS